MAENGTTPNPSEEAVVISGVSKENILQEYCRNKEAEKELLYKLDKATQIGTLDSFLSSSQDALITINGNYTSSNPGKYPNFVILSCKHNNVKILRHLLSQDLDLTKNLRCPYGINVILPTDEDDMHHNAFYYAIRSGNPQLLDTLILKWPQDYFTNHPTELDELLSKAYEELKLKNVLLTGKMEFAVEEKLIALRFFDSSVQYRKAEVDLNSTNQRIDLLLENVWLLNKYSSKKQVDEEFLFLSKFIARNMHILKHELKPTYAILPWEEIEFCLVSFISSQTKRQEINLFYNVILNKTKVLKYLKHFAKKLAAYRDSKNAFDSENVNVFPKLKRDEVIDQIIRETPEFEGLYNEYQEIRDIHSLMIINDYIKLAITVNPKLRDGQLVILRVLQVIGEFLKNTIESPKISISRCELLFKYLPKNAKTILTTLRNSLSHSQNLSERCLKENELNNIYEGIQNDIRTMDTLVMNTIYASKMKIVKILFDVINNTTDSLSSAKTLIEMVNNVPLDETFSDIAVRGQGDELEKLVNELSNNIQDKTKFENDQFDKINEIINNVKNKQMYQKRSCNFNHTAVQSFFISIEELNYQEVHLSASIMRVKQKAYQLLDNFVCPMNPLELKGIALLCVSILKSARSRNHGMKQGEINRIALDIYFLTEIGTNDIQFIKKLRAKLGEKDLMFETDYPKKVPGPNMNNTTEFDNLEEKFIELNNFLARNSLIGKTYKKFRSYKNDMKLQAALEFLVLDIMTILRQSNLIKESSILDDIAPLLGGKDLRNHLAHINIILDIGFSDPSIAIFLNAIKLIEWYTLKTEKKIKNLEGVDLVRLRERFSLSKMNILNQEKMFIAIEEGNVENLRSCLRNGADVKSRNTKSCRTTLHIAAKGTSLDIYRFVKSQIEVKDTDISGQTPLHVAVANKSNILECFLRDSNVCIDEVDAAGRSPLHIAALNDDNDSIELLLENNAATDIKDRFMYSPLHYTITKNNIYGAVLLLKKEKTAESNEAFRGITALHLSAYWGHWELCNILLENGANVNVRCDRYYTPLHAAASQGHCKVVAGLVKHRAVVDSKAINGCTPLHLAIQNGHESVVNTLLNLEASVNTTVTAEQIGSMHLATRLGNVAIIKTLLKYKANPNIRNSIGYTPLHLAVGHGDVVKLLFEHGVNFSPKTSNNESPFFFAALDGFPEICNLFIDKGVDINEKCRNDVTALHAATSRGHKSVIELLIARKAKVDAQNSSGHTPLHFAAATGKTDIIDLLVKSGATIDAMDFNGMTPLHAAARAGKKSAAAALIAKGAVVNVGCNYGLTALHQAAEGGHTEIVRLLIGHDAKVNVRGTSNWTPLHKAVASRWEEVVETLVAGASIVNDPSDSVTPLLLAVNVNNKRIVEILVGRKGAEASEMGRPLMAAVLLGYSDIVEVLIKNGASITLVNSDFQSLLHLATDRGHKNIVSTLIIKGDNVNATDCNGRTPLHLAVQAGHEEITEILIKAGASVNIKDDSNISPLQLAVANTNFHVVKSLLQTNEIDINSEDSKGWTVLHFACKERNLKIIEYLVEEGSDINKHNSSGSKPIHIAASSGFTEAVQFFINKGLSLNEVDSCNHSLLHSAAKNGRTEVVKYLASAGANVHAKDNNGQSPMHFAASCGEINIIEVLLQYGAFYNSVDNNNKRPIDMANGEHVINLFASTQKLFDALKHNNSSDLEESIKAGALINATSSDGDIPLHVAARKGCDDMVFNLLQNKADPNVVNSEGYTPLHYAIRFSNLKMAKVLLSYGAIYNVVSTNGKTPLDCKPKGARGKDIQKLINLIDNSFRKVKDDNVQVIEDINSVKYIDMVKALMSAQNMEKETLIVTAVLNNFSDIEKLKQVHQDHFNLQFRQALKFNSQGNYIKAAAAYRNIFERRKEIFGIDNPATLDIQTLIARSLKRQGCGEEALKLFEDILEKREKILGTNHRDTLKTRTETAGVMESLGNGEKALNIYEEVYHIQMKMLGPDHADTIESHFAIATVLANLGKLEDAVCALKDVYKRKKKNREETLRVLAFIGTTLANQKKYEESSIILQKVIKGKLSSDIDVLPFRGALSFVKSKQKKFKGVLTDLQEILYLQEKVLGGNNFQTLITKYYIGRALFEQGKYVRSLKVFSEILEAIKIVFGLNNLIVKDTLNSIEQIYIFLGLEGIKQADLYVLQKELNSAVSLGDISTIQKLLQNGSNPNDKDFDGKTSLHVAVVSGHLEVMNILLQNGANVIISTNMGKTPLHLAAVKNRSDLVEVLLQNVNHDKLNGYINAKILSSGATALHLAVDCFETVTSLMKYGAIYNIKNKELKTPLDISKNKDVTDILLFTDQVFRDIRLGNADVLKKLQTLGPGEFAAATNARDINLMTVVQVAILNKHKDIYTNLLAMLKNEMFP